MRNKYAYTDEDTIEITIKKHGDHDQSTHGSWATGNYDEEGLSENVGNAYNERYGIDNYGNVVGVSNDEFDALTNYAGNGYQKINQFLRGSTKGSDLNKYEYVEIVQNNEQMNEVAIEEWKVKNKVGDDWEMSDTNLEEAAHEYSFSEKHSEEVLAVYHEGKSPLGVRIKGDVEVLDKLISEAPELYTDSKGMPQKIFGDKNLYRAFSDRVLENLKEGDIFQDKGFLSTTRIDITQKEQGEARTWMGGINPSKDTIAVILPNETKSGKGLAVDMLRTAVDSYTGISDSEKEVLLPRNTPLRFIGYKKDVGNEARVAVFQRLDK